MSFKVMPVRGKLLGGHYAVEDSWGRVIGERWRLDKACAEELRHELEMTRNQAMEDRRETQASG
jgi:hypothetical protein